MTKKLLKFGYFIISLIIIQLFYFTYIHFQQVSKYENFHFYFEPSIFSKFAKKDNINEILPSYSQYEVKEYYDLKPLQKSTSSSEKDRFFYFVENNKNFLFRTDESLNLSLLIQNIDLSEEQKKYLKLIKETPDSFKNNGLFFDKSLIYKNEDNYNLTLSYKKDVGLFNKFFSLFFKNLNDKEMITIKVSNGIIEYRYQTQNKPANTEFIKQLFIQNSFLKLFNN